MTSRHDLKEHTNINTAGSLYQRIISSDSRILWAVKARTLFDSCLIFKCCLVCDGDQDFELCRHDFCVALIACMALVVNVNTVFTAAHQPQADPLA